MLARHERITDYQRDIVLIADAGSYPDDNIIFVSIFN